MCNTCFQRWSTCGPHMAVVWPTCGRQEAPKSCGDGELANQQVWMHSRCSYEPTHRRRRPYNSFGVVGRTSEERREAGLGFAIKSHLVSKLANLPRGINDRLMVMQLQLTNTQNATLITAYAPTMTNPE